MSQLDEISRLIGALQAGQDEGRQHRDRLEQKLDHGLRLLAERMELLIKEVREAAHRRANEAQAQIGDIDRRMASLERQAAECRGERRAHKTWAGILGAAAGALASAVVAHWDKIFGGGR